MTPTSEERTKILEMLENGNITPEEAAQLLKAIGNPGQGPNVSSTGGENRFLRVRVVDLTSGSNKVNVTVPLRLVNVGFSMAERFAPELDPAQLQEIQAAITAGGTGKIIEVEDIEDNERVEIYVE